MSKRRSGRRSRRPSRLANVVQPPRQRVGSRQLDAKRRRTKRQASLRSNLSRYRHDETPEAQRAYRLSGRLRNRGNLVQQPPRTVKRRVSPAVLPARAALEDAPKQKASRRDCARKKDTRRAVLLARGFGGINGRRNYAHHTRCK